MTVKGLLHPKNLNFANHYSPSSSSKPVRPSFIFRTQIKIFSRTTWIRCFYSNQRLSKCRKCNCGAADTEEHTLFAFSGNSPKWCYGETEEITCWIKLVLFSLNTKSIVVALSSVFWRWTEVLCVWNDIGVSNEWQKIHFGVEEPFKILVLVVQAAGLSCRCSGRYLKWRARPVVPLLSL